MNKKSRSKKDGDVCVVEERPKQYQFGFWYSINDFPYKDETEFLAYIRTEEEGHRLFTMRKMEDETLKFVVNCCDDSVFLGSEIVCWMPLPDFPFVTEPRAQEEDRQMLILLAGLTDSIEEELSDKEDEAVEWAKRKINEKKTVFISDSETFDSKCPAGLNAETGIPIVGVNTDE